MTLTFRSGQGLSFAELNRMAAVIAGTYSIPDSAGGAVTVSSGLVVAVAAITGNLVTINGTRQSTNYAGGTVTAGASSATLSRIDTVYYDGTATVAIAAGTPVLASATVFPVPPTLAAGQIALANLYVGLGYTAIGSADINDRRADLSMIFKEGAVIVSTGALPVVAQSHHVSGANTVTSLPTYPAGFQVTLTFDGACPITHNATSLILIGGASITTTAGDTLVFKSEGSGNWRQIGGPAVATVKVVGSNTAEQTMTSATAADLVTISGLSIPVTAAVMVVTNYRKSAVAAQLSIGLKLNSTIVAEADSSANSGIGLTAATNEVQDGLSIVYLGPRSTNYLRGLTLEYVCSGATGITIGAKGAIVLTNPLPNAVITSITIRGDSDGSATLGVKEVYVIQIGS